MSSAAFGILCVVLASSAMISEADSALELKGELKELLQALRAKRLLARRSWFGPVKREDHCSVSLMAERGLQIQTESSSPFGLCEQVRIANEFSSVIAAPPNFSKNAKCDLRFLILTLSSIHT